MKRLWIFSLLLCLGCYPKGQEVTFLTPLIKHTDAEGNTKVYVARPKGEYACIDIKDSHEAFVTLVSNSVQPFFQFNMANRIGANPGIYNPSALLALGILRLRHKDYEQGAFFVRAALLRTYIDVQLSQDPSLQGLGQIMTQQVNQFVPNLDEEAFFNAWDAVTDEVITWDKEVPRLYDRRWASLHSIGFYNQKPLNYLPLSEEPRIIEEAYRLFSTQN